VQVPCLLPEGTLFCYLVSKFSESLGKKYQGTVVGFIYITGFGMWSLSAPLGGWLMKWMLNGALLMAPTSMFALLLFLKIIKRRPGLIFDFG
jgi:hypothetical protein